MLTIALTGNIGSGKTTVANLFAECGAPIVDTDQLSREAVLPGSEALSKIVARFGDSILLPSGELNRQQLRGVIFDAPNERVWLENVLHPIIRQKAKDILEKLNTPYALYVVPLLLDREPTSFIQRILVVDTPLELQRTRVLGRDQISEESLQKILVAQTSREKLLAAADDIIVNDHSLEHLKTQVIQLHQFYLSMTMRD